MGWESLVRFPYLLIHYQMENKIRTAPIQREHNRTLMAALVVTELLLAATHQPISIQRQLNALRGRIQLCNDPENVWIAKAAYHNGDRPRTDAIDKFWRCNSKLCSSCLAKQALLSRRKLRTAIASQEPNSGKYFFVTFTIPNPDISLLETRSIVDRAWTLFRKRSLCVSLFRGGVKAEEFTVTKNGFHYHLHCIFLVKKWFLYNELRRSWTDCVEQSFIDHERPFECKNKDNMLSVVIKPITPTERAIQEVCKYVTKADSWSKMRHQDLVEIALVQRWCRMFELFGSFSLSAIRAEGTRIAIVHTKSLTDGFRHNTAKYWRKIIEIMDVDVYLINLEDKIIRSREFQWRDLRQRFPNCTVTTLAHLA